MGVFIAVEHFFNETTLHAKAQQSFSTGKQSKSWSKSEGKGDQTAVADTVAFSPSVLVKCSLCSCHQTHTRTLHGWLKKTIHGI